MFDFVLASIYPLMVGEYQCPQLRGHCQIQPVINDLRLDFGTIFNQHTPAISVTEQGYSPYSSRRPASSITLHGFHVPAADHLPIQR